MFYHNTNFKGGSVFRGRVNIIWFFGNKVGDALKIVISSKEDKRIRLKTLTLESGQWFKTYGFILDEVERKFDDSGLFQELKEPSGLWKAIWKSFDISIVNKKFYAEIKEVFDSLIKDELPKAEGIFKNEQEMVQFTIRLIGRIMFCWFLKRKGIISDEVLSSNAISSYSSYHNDLLTPLFFDVLNTPKDDRKKELQDSIIDYPFLNGGLFDPQTHDYDESKNLNISNNWFTDFFSNTLEKYNFTVDENTASSSEIAIDPEMLGRIFENLLAEQNPETGETARKATGSYYTPREIVDFMVEESLITYLKNKLIVPEAKIDSSKKDEAIEEFVHTVLLQPNSILESYKEALLGILNEIKVIDPACGSGAFPISILQKLVALKLELIGKHKNEKEYRKLLYKTKLETIQNSIFGIDIQPLAVELSRLRCWLTLIIEEDDPEPLPNLDFKFVCANSLIGLPERKTQKEIFKAFGVNEADKEIDKLKKLRETYFVSNGKKKLALEHKFRDIQGNMLRQGRTSKTREIKKDIMLTEALYEWKPFENKPTQWFDSEWMFGIKGGFTLVIGNPPYGLLNKKQNKKMGHIASLDQIKRFKTSSEYKPAIKGMINVYVLFILKSISLLKSNGIFTEIFPLAFAGDISAGKLRKYIFENCKIININAFPERDNERKRVFPAVKMSVCIMNLIKKKSIDDFFLRIYPDREINVDREKAYIKLKTIELIDSKNFNIPLLTRKDIKIVEKVYKESLRVSDIGHCYTGEVDLSIDKKYLSENTNDSKLIKGAIVDKYKIRKSMSQGEIKHLNSKRYLGERTGTKTTHHKKERIVMQAITGVNENIRLKMTILSKNIFCANSVNYLHLLDNSLSPYYVLSLLNSSFLNYLFSKFSTNSNVNGYEIDNLPIKKITTEDQGSFIDITSQILNFKEKDSQAVTTELEQKIDTMVYELYDLTPEEIKIVEGGK